MGISGCNCMKWSMWLWGAQNYVSFQKWSVKQFQKMWRSGVLPCMYWGWSLLESSSTRHYLVNFLGLRHCSWWSPIKHSLLEQHPFTIVPARNLHLVQDFSHSCLWAYHILLMIIGDVPAMCVSARYCQRIFVVYVVMFGFVRGPARRAKTDCHLSWLHPYNDMFLWIGLRKNLKQEPSIFPSRSWGFPISIFP